MKQPFHFFPGHQKAFTVPIEPYKASELYVVIPIKTKSRGLIKIEITPTIVLQEILHFKFDLTYKLYEKNLEYYKFLTLKLINLPNTVQLIQFKVDKTKSTPNELPTLKLTNGINLERPTAICIFKANKVPMDIVDPISPVIKEENYILSGTPTDSCTIPPPGGSN